MALSSFNWAVGSLGNNIRWKEVNLLIAILFDLLEQDPNI